MKKLKLVLLNSRILLLLLLLALFAGCSDDEGSTTEPGTLDRLFSYPVITSCGSCHYSGVNGPDLSTKDAFYATAVGKNGFNLNWDQIGNVGSAITDTEKSCIKKHNLITPKSVKDSAIMYTVSSNYQNQTYCQSSFNYHSGAVVKAEVTGEALVDLELWIRNGAPR